MKILKWSLLILGVIFLISIVGAILVIKFYNFDKLRPVILEQVKKVTGRDVQLEKISLNFSLKNGLALSLENILVPDDATYDAKSLLSIKQINCGLEIWPLIFKKQIMVKQIDIVKPQLNVVLLQDGKDNNISALAQSLTDGGVAQQKSPNIGKDDQLSINVSEKSSLVLPDIKIKGINLTEGLLTLVQKQEKQNLMAAVEDINLNIKNFSFDQFVDFNFNAKILSNDPVLEGQGQFVIDSKDFSLKFVNSRFKLDVNRVDLTKVIALIPVLKDAKLSKNFEGQGVYDIESLGINSAGLKSLKSSLNFKNGKIFSEWLQQPIENISVKAEITEQMLDLKELKFLVAAGDVVSKAQIKNYMSQPEIVGENVIQALDVQELLAIFKLPYKVEGKMNGQFKMGGVGFDGIKADGILNFESTKIVDFNLLKFVIEQLSFVPILYQKFYKKLPENDKHYLTDTDTVFEQLSVQVKWENQKIIFNQGIVKTQGMELNFNGDLDLQQNLNFYLVILLNEKFSENLVNSEESLKYLMNEQGKLAFLFKPFKGPANKFITYPDVEKVAKDYILNRGKDELRNVIFDVLGVEDQQNNLPTTNSPTTPNEVKDGPSGVEENNKKAPSAEQQLLEGVLDKIFK